MCAPHTRADGRGEDYQIFSLSVRPRVCMSGFPIKPGTPFEVSIPTALDMKPSSFRPPRTCFSSFLPPPPLAPAQGGQWSARPKAQTDCVLGAPGALRRQLRCVESHEGGGRTENNNRLARLLLFSVRSCAACKPTRTSMSIRSGSIQKASDHFVNQPRMCRES